MDLIATTNATLNAVAKVLDYFKENVAGHLNDSSLTSITKLTRAEPLTVISNDCANLDYLPDILNGIVSIYSGYFLQAVAILTRVNDIEVVRILDRLNPDRDSTGFLLQGRMATENAHTLMLSNYKYSLPTRKIIAVESDRPMLDQQNQKTIYETANLAVGKLINVSIATGSEAEGTCKVVNIPVSVRLAPALLNDESLVQIFTHRKEDTGIVERWHSYRAGRISLIKDMIFCQDLIKEYRRAAIKDRTGTLNEIARRVSNARAYGLLTNNPSLAVSSNVYVLSKASAQAIEAKTGKRFSNPQGREDILEHTYAMVVAVIDDEWGTTTFYFNGIAQPMVIKNTALKAANKGKGPDIADIMKSLLEGRAPSF